MTFDTDKAELLRSSWEGIAGTPETTGILMYTKMFTDHPELYPLFKFAQEKPVAQLHESKRFLRHAKGVMKTVGGAVDGLSDDAALRESLRALAIRHVPYGATVDMYPHVGAALLHALEQRLGNAWTPEVKNAWVDFYTYISEVMEEAMAAEIAKRQASG